MLPKKKKPQTLSGPVLAELMRAHGITGVALARRIDCHPNWVYDVLQEKHWFAKGKRCNPATPAQLERFHKGILEIIAEQLAAGK